MICKAPKSQKESGRMCVYSACKGCPYSLTLCAPDGVRWRSLGKLLDWQRWKRLPR